MAAIATARSAHAGETRPQGLYAPAEEAPHVRTWMCWPATASIYGGQGSYWEDVKATLARLANAIAEHEPVAMAAGPEHHDEARRLLSESVELIAIPTDDMWARDNGPVFVVDGRGGLGAVDFNFNGWGNKQAHGRDRGIPAAIAEHLACPLLPSVLVGEGGGVEYDGEGTVILADGCWKNDNRNPGMDWPAIEAALKADLGASKVIALPGVIGHDITDGHIDGSVRIVRPGLLALEGLGDDDTSVFGEALERYAAILATETDARGRAFERVHLPVARTWRSAHPDFYPMYANYYVANGAVIAPQFGDPAADEATRDTLARLYPGRTVVTLDVDRIYENGGGIHCVTQQQPVA